MYFAKWSGCTLPPLTIAATVPTGAPSPSMTAAVVAAPLGSATIRAWRNNQRHGLGHGLVGHGHQVVDKALHVREGEVAGPHVHDAVGDARRLVERHGMPGGAGDARIFMAPVGSTPTTRTSGRDSLIAAATPAIRPPPPIGT